MPPTTIALPSSWSSVPAASRPGACFQSPASARRSRSSTPARSWTTDSGARPLVPERELGVLGHHLRGPGRVENHLREDVVNPVELAHVVAHLLRDLGADRAGRGRQAKGDVDLLPVDVDVVHETEGDEIEPE